MSNTTINLDMMMQQQMARLRKPEIAVASSSAISAPPSPSTNKNADSKKDLDWAPIGYPSAAPDVGGVGNNDCLLGMAASLFGVDSYAAAASSSVTRGPGAQPSSNSNSNSSNGLSGHYHQQHHRNYNQSHVVNVNNHVNVRRYPHQQQQQQQQQQQLQPYQHQNHHQNHHQYQYQYQYQPHPSSGYGRAATAATSQHPPMMFPNDMSPMLTPQQQLARSVDITSQVLSELPSDMFGEDLFDADIFDQTELEPIPLDPTRINVIKTPNQTLPQSHSSLAVLEETLSVLDQDTNLDMFNQQTSTSTSTSSNRLYSNVAVHLPSAPQHQHQQQQYPFAVPSSANVSNVNVNVKRSATDVDNKRPAKKQRAASNNNNNNNEEDEQDQRRFRPYQSEQWKEKFDELLQFKKERGHCCVPHTFEENPALARWVKRQRYQYKLMNEAKQSTMTPERVVTLEHVGFIWDSHSAAWYDRLNELKLYKASHDNCNVPSNYPANPQLATWIKCQRRQYKLLFDGNKTSNMTMDRIAELEGLGFEWELRSHGKNKPNKVAGGVRRKVDIQQQQHQQPQAMFSQYSQQQQHAATEMFLQQHTLTML